MLKLTVYKYYRFSPVWDALILISHPKGGYPLLR